MSEVRRPCVLVCRWRYLRCALMSTQVHQRHPDSSQEIKLASRLVPSQWSCTKRPRPFSTLQHFFEHLISFLACPLGHFFFCHHLDSRPPQHTGQWGYHSSARDIVEHVVHLALLRGPSSSRRPQDSDPDIPARGLRIFESAHGACTSLRPHAARPP